MYQCTLQERVIIIWVIDEETGKITFHSVLCEKSESFLVSILYINQWAVKKASAQGNTEQTKKSILPNTICQVK